MKLRTFILSFLTLCYFISLAQDEAKIKITEDKFNKIYRVFFASENEYNVTLNLKSPFSNELIINESVSGKGFIKKYNLSELQPGTYTFVIKYAFEEFEQEIKVLSDSQLKKQNINVSIDDLLNLKITVINPETDPLNLLFYNSSGEQLDYIFWEPREGDLEKSYNLSQLDAYDIKVEILQNGNGIFSETYSTY